MLIHNDFIPVDSLSIQSALKFNNKDILDKAIFFDLEHYLYKEPICIGVFGAAVYSKEHNAIISTQYMIENQKDARQILTMTEEYFKERMKDGKEYIVTFSGNNDFLVVNHLFKKYNIEFCFKDHFEHVDLQKEYEVRFKKNIGLKNLERLYKIERQGELISGINLAKTFSRIIKDKGYIQRMPQEKINKILTYNEQDVVNLFNIMNQWKQVEIDDVITLEEILLEEKAEKLELKRKLEEENEKNSTLRTELRDLMGELDFQ